MYSSIRPGQEWLDTSGKPIQAHGGSVLISNGVFYWYGENKERTTGGRKIWTWGIRCYSSRDLYNWQDEGLIIPPNLDDTNSVLYPSKLIDRPHIVFNEKTGKYVCWLKIMAKESYFAILTAENLKGPYKIENANFHPVGKNVGDFDIIKDESTGKATIIFEADHELVVSVDLSADYLDIVGSHAEHFAGRKPPFVREAPAHFSRNSLHYLATSGMSGYIPNPSEIAVSKELHGPYDIQGNLHPNDDSLASFNSQISCIFKHPEKQDLYIAMADRWLPKYIMDAKRSKWLERSIASRYNKEYKASLWDLLKLGGSPIVQTSNTSIARYVWLPLRFDGDRPRIDWFDEWKVEDFR